MALTLCGLGGYVGLCLFHFVRCICKRISVLIQVILKENPAFIERVGGEVNEFPLKGLNLQI